MTMFVHIPRIFQSTNMSIYICMNLYQKYKVSATKGQSLSNYITLLYNITFQYITLHYIALR